MNAVAKLRLALKTATEQRDALLNNPEIDDAGVEKVHQLNADITKIAAQIRTLVAAGEAVDVPEERTAPTGNVGNGVQMLGMVHNGEQTTVQTDGRTTRVIDQDGAGDISERQWAAISEPNYERAFCAYARAMRMGGMDFMSSTDRRTLEEGLDPAGGYLVPAEYIARLISKKPAPTRVSGRCSALATSRDRITLPKVSYPTDDIWTTGIRYTWTGENPASATAARVTDPIFSTVSIDVFTAMMTGVITFDMAEDSAFPLLGWIADKFGETRDLASDYYVLKGSGVGQPYGIMSSIGLDGGISSVLSTVAGSFDATSIRTLPFNVPEQYVQNSCFVMNRISGGKTLVGLKDSNNRFMFATGSYDDKLAAKSPDSLDGFPLVYSAFMDDIGASNYPILFGDLGGCTIVNRVALSITFLREIYAQNNQLGILGRLRWGSKVLEPWRMIAMKSNNS